MARLKLKRLNLQENGRTLLLKEVFVQVPARWPRPNQSVTSYFDRTYKKEASRVTILRSIRPSVDGKCAETIYITMILLTFTRCGSVGLVWSDTRKSPIKNIEQRSLRIIGNKGLKVSSIENTIKRKNGQLVFECLQNNVFSSFKSYIERLDHSVQETMVFKQNCLKFASGKKVLIPLKPRFLMSSQLDFDP